MFTWASLRCIALVRYVPVPGIPFQEMLGLSSCSNSARGMTMLDLFTGGALSNVRVLAGHHALHHRIDHHAADAGRYPGWLGLLARARPVGARLPRYTRYLTLALALINAVGYLFLFKSSATAWGSTGEVPEIVSPTSSSVFTLVAVPRSSCGWVSSSPSAVSATACRSSSS